MAFGGPRDQAVCAGAGLHVGEQGSEAERIAGELVAHRRQRGAGKGLVGDGVQDDTGDQRLGFFVSVRLATLPQRVVNKRVGDRLCVFRKVRTGGVQPS